MRLPSEIWTVVCEHFDLFDHSSWRQILNISQTCSDAMSAVKYLNHKRRETIYRCEHRTRKNLSFEFHAAYPRPFLSICLEQTHLQDKKQVKKEAVIMMHSCPDKKECATFTVYHALEPKTTYHTLSQQQPHECIFITTTKGIDLFNIEESFQMYQMKINDMLISRLQNFLGFVTCTVV